MIQTQTPEARSQPKIGLDVSKQIAVVHTATCGCQVWEVNAYGGLILMTPSYEVRRCAKHRSADDLIRSLRAGKRLIERLATVPEEVGGQEIVEGLEDIRDALCRATAKQGRTERGDD